MSHEYKIHHLTSQLLQLLQLQHLSPDSYNDTLLRHATPYVTTQVSSQNAIKKIVEHTTKKEEFLERYSSLKIKQPRELDALVYILSKLAEEPRLCDFIRERRPPPVERVPAQVTKFEQLDIPEGVVAPALPKEGEVLSSRQLETLKGQLAVFASKMEEADKKKKQRKDAIRGQFPYLPSWLTSRQYLTSDYVKPLPVPTGKIPIGALPLHAQQLAIIDDLLFLMQGSSGRFITADKLPENGKRSFSLDKTLDISLQTLVLRILPLCSHYSTVARFIEEHAKFVHGTVNQALSAAIRGLLREYLLIVVQLEHQFNIGELTLQKMWYYVQPCMRTMEVLARVASTVNKARHCRGGRTLTLLNAMTSGMMGDLKSQDVVLHITRCAAAPFFEMLSLWLQRGEVNDPYDEFMIFENTEITIGSLHEEYNDYFWERRYMVSQDNTPVFLEQLAEKILHTGKFLNVVRNCGKQLKVPENLPELTYTLKEKYYLELIEEAYSHSSKQLLQLMMEEYDLLNFLRSIKHYFLLDQGDLFVHFMDMAYDELQKPIGLILMPRLESLMELALRTSVSDSDPYKDNLRVILEPYNLKMFLHHVISVRPEQPEDGISPPVVTRPASSTALPGYECFSIDYQVKWPLSLVISRRCLTRYQLLFRHIFFCKYVERELAFGWKSNKGVKQRLLSRNGTMCSTAAFSVLQRMLNFVQGLQYYMSYEVLEPNWRQLERSLSNVSTIDEVLARHTDFIDKCLKDCLLTNREVVELTNSIIQCCLEFANHMQDLSGGMTINRDDALEEVKKHERIFTKDLSALLSILQDMSRIESERSWGHLITRLDYNSFYSS